jgi:hypothetical protein
MRHEVGTVLPNAAGGFSVRLDCEAGGKKLSHDTAHILKTNIPAKSVFFTVETNLEVRCGFADARGIRLTPTKK